MSKKKGDFKKIDFNDYEIIIDIQDWLDDLGVHYKKSGTGELICDKCFNCGSKEKLYINSKTGRYNCFKCGPKDPTIGKGSLINLGMKMAKMSWDECLKTFYGITDKNEKATMSELMNDDGDLIKKKRVHEQIIVEPIQLPYYFEPLNKQKHLEAWDYLLKRGLSESSIERLGAFYAIYGTDEFDEKTGSLVAKNKVPRIVNVVYLNGDPMGFVARDITGQSPKKVLNSTGKFRSMSIWNMDRARESKELIICEGIFSAVQCGINRSIALLGKTATEKQLDLIREAKAEKVYICLDLETEAEQETLFKSLMLYFPKKIYQIKMPEILALKKNKLSLELKQKIETVFKVKFDYLDNQENLLKMPIKVRQKLKLVYLTKRSQFSEDEFRIVEFVCKKAEYKDAGDYSESEMNEIIKNSPLYRQKGLLI